MLGALRLAATTVMQAIYDIGWSGAEASQLIWEEQTQNWEDLENLEGEGLYYGKIRRTKDSR